MEMSAIFVCGRMGEIKSNLSFVLFCSSTTSHRTCFIFWTSSSNRAAHIKTDASYKIKYAKSYICCNCNMCIFTFSSIYLLMLLAYNSFYSLLSYLCVAKIFSMK